ncbi:MAG: ABC-2 transporter permease, partial [Actinomycetia bacterium]|nr:ABC-2 transporter permease [Actinomycetes bacterium]
IKKAFGFVTRFQLPVVVVVIGFWLLSRQEFGFTFLALIGALTFLSLMAEINVNEQLEEKYHGYSFLRTLPISAMEVVGAKFAAILFLDFILVASALALFSFTGDTPRIWSLGKALILGIGSVGLISSGLFYIGIFRFGYAKFMRTAVFAILSFSVIFTMIVAKNLVSRLNMSPDEIINFIENINWVAVAAATLGFYILLLLLAVKVMDNRMRDAA